MSWLACEPAILLACMHAHMQAYLHVYAHVCIGIQTINKKLADYDASQTRNDPQDRQVHLCHAQQLAL